jgi:hypothetical protein
MGNMSYCRFENTFHDLQDCAGALEESDELSESETRFRKNLIELCVSIAKEFGEDQ